MRLAGLTLLHPKTMRWLSCSILFFGMSSASAQSCNVFVLLGDNSTFQTTSSTVTRISKGVTCRANPGNTTLHHTTCVDGCAVVIAGTIELHGTNNLSLPDANVSALYPVVERSLINNFARLSYTIPSLAVRGSTNNVACAPANSSGYFTYQAVLNCVRGRFYACSNASVVDGQPMELCAAAWANYSSLPLFNQEFVRENASVTSLTDYPAATGPVSNRGDRSRGDLERAAGLGVAGVAAAVLAFA